MFNPLGTVLDPKKSKTKYPEGRVLVLDDSFNTFQYVANCLLAIIPSMTEKNDQKGVRSLNLSVACGIAIYEAHKQINFQNGN